MKRAIDIGPVDAAATKTAGGKVRLRLLFTMEQLAALMEVAGGEGEDDDTEAQAKPAAPEPPKRVFVREGTPAWDAWTTHKRRTHPDWNLTVQHTDNGRRVTGWWFPSLFPPNAGAKPEALTEDDTNVLSSEFK